MRGFSYGGGILNEEQIARANVTIEVRDANTNELIQRRKLHNLVVTAGKNLIRDFLAGDSVTGLTHFAIGTGSATPLLTDMTLQSEIFRATLTSKSKTAAKLTCTYFLDTGDCNGYSLTEAGILTASSGGTLYARAVYAAISKTSSITVNYTWELTWS